MSWVSRVTRGIRQPSPVPNGFSGTGTVPGGYLCLTGTYHGYPGVPIPVLHLTSTSTSASTSTSSSTPSSSDKKRTPPAKNTSDSPLAKVLTPSGHLTPEEKERRRREGLCTYCGEAGHLAVKCPKNSSKPKETKARATATISVVSDNEEASENASDA